MGKRETSSSPRPQAMWVLSVTALTAYARVFGKVGAQEITAEGINEKPRVNVHCPVNTYEADLTTECRVQLGNR